MATRWSSKLGFILAAAGSAIGLGNIWRFPYLLSQYGGGAFLIVYLLTIFGMGIVILTFKLSFGHVAQTDLPQGFDKVAKDRKIALSPFWRYGGGYLGVFNCSLVICVYLIVVSWTLYYAVVGGINLLMQQPIPMGEETFHTFTSSFDHQLFWITCCIMLCVFILAKGIKKGIEKVCIILMPLFFFFLIFLSLWMVFSSDMNRTLYFLLHPDWSKFGITDSGIDFPVLSEALLAVFGQSLYSLSLGLGVMFVYGSYMDKKTDILKSVRWIALMDTLVAFLSGFIVVSVLAQENLSTNQGPELSFITLPLIFNKMWGGPVLMFAFFVLLFLAALTSIISMYEVPINTLMKGERMSRKKAVYWVGFGNWLGSLFILLSLTKVVPLTFGDKDLFVLFDNLTGEYTLALMMGICSLFMGWKIFPVLISDVQQTMQKPISKFKRIYWQTLLKWIVPVIFGCLILSVLFK